MLMSKNVNNDVSKVPPIPTLILGRSTIVFITMLIGDKIICFRALILPLKNARQLFREIF